MKKKFLSIVMASGLALTGVFGSVPSVYADTNVGTAMEVVMPTAGVTGQVTINGAIYKYMEKSYGTNRGIMFNPGQHEYKISPNPHDNPKYNKNQEKFYNEIAEGVKKVIESKGSTTVWDDKYTDIEALGLDYTLEIR